MIHRLAAPHRSSPYFISDRSISQRKFPCRPPPPQHPLSCQSSQACRSLLVCQIVPPCQTTFPFTGFHYTHLALPRRQPPPGLLHHSDRGSQYTSLAYQARLAQLNCQVSMSRRGNCYDNAVMESFFSTLKTECVTSQFVTRQQARTSIFEFIEVWYNRKRLHSSLGYLSPLEFEQSSRH